MTEYREKQVEGVNAIAQSCLRDSRATSFQLSATSSREKQGAFQVRKRFVVRNKKSADDRV